MPDTSINKDIGPNQEEWLTALESGDYRQCQEQLANDIGYCCLGVGALLFGCERTVYTFDGYSDVAPPKVIAALALHDKQGGAEAGSRSLVTLNDDDNESFAEIAKICRANPKDYFSEPR